MILQHQDDFRSTVLRFRNTDVRKTKQNNDSKAKMCDSSAFLLPKYRQSDFCAQFYGFEQKTPFLLFFHMPLRFFCLRLDVGAQKSEKKNAANDAQGDGNSISTRFMRSQKTEKVR